MKVVYDEKKLIKSTNTAGYIYLPKKFIGKIARVIIGDGKDDRDCGEEVEEA